jgi:tryptophan-rich sensory protein
MRVARPRLLLGIVGLLIASNGLEALTVQDGLKHWWPSVAKPWFLLPEWAFMLTGLYFAIAVGTLLYRLWPIGNRAARVGIGLTVAVVVTNSLWNFIVFEMHRLDLSFYILTVYLAICWMLVFFSHRVDKPSARIFIPYAVYAIYALAYGYELWRLNPA